MAEFLPAESLCSSSLARVTQRWVCSQVIVQPHLYLVIETPIVTLSLSPYALKHVMWRAYFRGHSVMGVQSSELDKVSGTFCKVYVRRMLGWSYISSLHSADGPQQARNSYPLLQLGASRFCSEKGKKLLRNMPKSCSKVAKLWKSCSKILSSCSNIFKTACLILITIAL